jgi:RNA polymerase sigma factor (sigma-70 family)
VSDLDALITRAQRGDADAYGLLVRRFQDMTVAYGCSILRDWQAAEDASQEAFLEAFRDLPALRETAAFPGWLRRIVFKQCDRILRRRRIATVPLEHLEPAAQTPDALDSLEQRELNDQILDALHLLPEHERMSAMLFYMSGFSQKEIGAFLGVPVSTVKKRVHSARSRLREQLLATLEDSLRERRPSRDERFATRVLEILKAARAGDSARVKELLEQDPRLLSARDPLGNTALIIAASAGHEELVELLLASGIEIDIHEAAAIGRTERVRELLQDDPDALDSYSAEGFTPLALAAHFGHLETTALLLKRGANVNAVSRHVLGVTPLHAALFGRRPEIVKLLLAHGADVRLPRAGKGLPRAGWTALHYAAGHGFADLVEPLLERGAAVDARDAEGMTPLEVAQKQGHDGIAAILRRHASAPAPAQRRQT